MYIPNDDTQNTQQNEPANQNQIKIAKVFKPMNKKMLL